MGMYVVTKTGEKLPVDDSAIKDNAFLPFHQTVGLYTDDTVLKDVWYVQLVKNPHMKPSRYKNVEYETVAEIVYDHEPSKEELLWAMSAHGLTRYDMVLITKGYQLDMADTDD